jgi:hypothetical protein
MISALDSVVKQDHDSSYKWSASGYGRFNTSKSNRDRKITADLDSMPLPKVKHRPSTPVATLGACVRVSKWISYAKYDAGGGKRGRTQVSGHAPPSFGQLVTRTSGLWSRVLKRLQIATLGCRTNLLDFHTAHSLQCHILKLRQHQQKHNTGLA